MKKTRTIIIDGVEIETSLSAIEIADLSIKNADLEERISKAIEYNQIVSNSDYVYSQDEIANKNIRILKGE